MIKNNAAFLVMAAALFAALAAVSFVVPALAGEAAKKYDGLVIRVATQPGQVQPVLSDELGYFKDEFGADGITFDVRTFPSGPPIIEAIASGSLEIGLVGGLPAIQAAGNGIPIKIIGAHMTGNGKNQGLLARKGSGITSLGDIKGRKIGVQIGSTSHFLLMQYLKKAGLGEDEVQIVNLSFGDINSALEAGNIDCGVSSLPQMASVLESGAATLVGDASEYLLPPSVITVRTDFIEQYPGLIPRILKTFSRASNFSRENENEAIRVLRGRHDVPESAYKLTFAYHSFDLFVDEARLATIKASEEFLRKEGTTRGVDVEKLVDVSFLEAAGLNK
jgi:sulfonate transport system substrate-binding protein